MWRQGDGEQGSGVGCGRRADCAGAGTVRAGLAAGAGRATAHAGTDHQPVAGTS